MVTAAMALTLGSRGLTVPLYGDQLGANRGQVGLLVSSWVLVAGVLSLPAGALADRFGPRRLLLLSLGAFAASQLASALTTTLPMLYLTQVVGGIGGAGSQTALLVILTGVAPRNRLGRSLGWFTLAVQVGQLAGPALAGILLAWLPLRAVFLVFAAPLLIAIGLGALLPDAAIEGGRASLRAFARVLRNRRFAGLLIAFAAVIAPWGVYQANIAVLAHRGFGLSGPGVGYLLALAAVAGAASRLPAGALVDRLATQRTLPITLPAIAIAGCLAVLPHLHGFVAPAVLVIVMAPFLALALMATGMRFVELTPVDARGLGLGVYSAANYIGFAAGAVAFAPLMDAGYVAGFTGAAVAAVALATAAIALELAPRPTGVLRAGQGS